MCSCLYNVTGSNKKNVEPVLKGNGYLGHNGVNKTTCIG